MFIDTPYNFTSAPLEDKYTLVKTTVYAFNGEPILQNRYISILRLKGISVNTIVVLGNEKLTVEMQKLFNENSPAQHKVTVLKIPRSAGVAELDHGSFNYIIAFGTSWTSPARLTDSLSRSRARIPTSQLLLWRSTATTRGTNKVRDRKRQIGWRGRHGPCTFPAFITSFV